MIIVHEMTSHSTGTVQNSQEGKCTKVGLQTCFEDRWLGG